MDSCKWRQVYKSSKTISPLTSYNVGATNLNSIFFIDGNTGYVCGDGGWVYKSIDGGTTWSASNSGISPVKLNSICFNDASNGTVVGNNGNIFNTNDGGLSWTSQTSGTGYNLLKVKYFNGSLVAVGEYGTLLVNTGSGWTGIASRTKTDIRGVTGTSISDVHVCGGGGFIRNNKNGSSNFYNFEINPMMANLVDIFYSDNNKGWAVSSLNSVIIYTTNGGTNWRMPSGASVSYSWVSKLTANGGIGNNLSEHPFNRDALFVVYGSTVYRSGNRGDTWTNIASISGGGSAHSFYVSPLDTNIWMVAITGNPDKIKRTTNYGATWKNVDSANFSNYGQPLEMDQNDPSTYYFAPDGGGFRRSVDNGQTFQEISGNYPFRSPCDIIVMWDSSKILFVGDGITGSGQAIIFKSTNGGFNWTNIISTASSEVPSMCNSVFDKSIAYATNWGGGQLYKTTNYGNSFYLHSTQSSSGWGSDICHEDPTLILKGTYGSPTWLSTNSGANFTSTSVGGGAGAGIIVPERGYLIAMQTGGLSKMSINYTDVPVLITQYNIKLAPEGMYNGVSLNLRDTVKAYLRNIISPFNFVDSSVSVIDPITLNAEFIFKNAPTGTYYIQIIHRNSLETWSKPGGEAITRGVTASYDFTSAQTQAYGNNSVQIGTKWCLYSGDVIKNGIIELIDVLEIYNNASDFVSGYVVSDLTGEGAVDLTDILIAYNNSSNFVTKKTPETSPVSAKSVKENSRIKLVDFEKNQSSK